MSIGATIFFGSEPPMLSSPSFEEACPPSPLSCPRCVEGSCTGFVVQASSPTIVPAQSEVVFPGLIRLKNELAYPKDKGFFSPNLLLQQRLGLAAASSLSHPSPDSTVPIRLLNLVFTSHRLWLSLSRTAIVASRPLMAPLRAKMSRSSLRHPRHAPVAFVVAPRVLPTSPVSGQGHCHLLSCSYFLFLVTSLLLFCGSRLLLFSLFLVLFVYSLLSHHCAQVAYVVVATLSRR